ncbi:MAG: transglycosylase domain-containing protein [Clostridium sp.]|nr:transglycosylase domain-containing protein [Clostridium sp.]MCM1443992.1 transglycosylase domain-containing protein [Candidatus Amulumruptor caecigallinarius]
MKVIKNIILILFLVGLGIVLYYGINGYNLYKKLITETPLEEKIKSIRDNKNYTKLEDISPDFINAVIAVEDHRFYSHSGIDIISTIKAIFINVKEASYVTGGSTITQQLAKNMYFSQEKKMLRKVAEMFMTYELEDVLDKDEILELYVNTIYYGSGYYNVRSASLGYFSKEPSELTLDEASLLAGIPNAPSVYSLDVNPDLAYQRQKQVISAMKEYDYINDLEYKELIKK